MSKTHTAGVVIIGNEILSGRTRDANTPWIAETLGKHGISVVEVRIVPDVEEKIVEAVNALRGQVDYLFTTGGIGPTHDDITAESIAKALDAELGQNAEALQLLENHYAPKDPTEAQKKMALIPQGASLIPNPVSSAPGFIIENVYVMAGVPKIMQGMLDHIISMIEPGQVILSATVMCTLPESTVAEGLGKIQDKYKEVEIGSYPHFRAGSLGVSVVLRSVDEKKLKAASKEVEQMIYDFGTEPLAVT